MIFAFCKTYGNFIKNGGQNGSKIDAKIIKTRLWVAKGSPGTDCDCFLGGFWRSLIFDEFSIGKKTPKNQKNRPKERPRGSKGSPQLRRWYGLVGSGPLGRRLFARVKASRLISKG